MPTTVMEEGKAGRRAAATADLSVLGFCTSLDKRSLRG